MENNSQIAKFITKTWFTRFVLEMRKVRNYSLINQLIDIINNNRKNNVFINFINIIDIDNISPEHIRLPRIFYQIDKEFDKEGVVESVLEIMNFQ